MSGTFSGMFRNVRTKAECSDTIPVGTTTKCIRNVRNVFRNAAVTVLVLPPMLFCHQSRDLSKNMVEWL